MARRSIASLWTRTFERSLATFTRSAVRSGTRALADALERTPLRARRATPKGAGDWLPGLAVGSAGARRFRLYRPRGVAVGESLPLMVMLHGCGQDAAAFADSTRMNRLAERERFFVLYPEQDRLANAQGCWNWFDTASGRAQAEAMLIINAIDQVCLRHRIDPSRVAVAGLSAGASMAALLAARHPGRFKAVVMHSGIPPGTAHSGLSALGAMQGRRATRGLAGARDPQAAAMPPLLVIHGARDAVVSPHNGRAAAQAWAQAAGARAGTARSVQRGARYPTVVVDFKARGRVAATWVEVLRLGHVWSGGADRRPAGAGQGPDASRMAWAFARRQFGS
ncbi:MAG TPA: PHB depolymerase family esterase [Burkholderiaceae bacterium]|nr:PHB depolymerase family esterase [Burkholderiaceae bacterium]